MSNDIKTISDFYGYDAQSRQLIEEMAELTQTINKFWRKCLDYGLISIEDIRREEKQNPSSTKLEDIKEFQNIVEEIADVEIMLAQIKYLLNCEHDVEKCKDYKVARTLKRIEDEDN